MCTADERSVSAGRSWPTACQIVLLRILLSKPAVAQCPAETDASGSRTDKVGFYVAGLPYILRSKTYAIPRTRSRHDG